jgi:hypothetical protein
MLLKSEAEFRNSWKELIRQLLNLGPDLHTSRILEGGTILDEIMDVADSPFESYGLGGEWLAILESSSIDIGKYLRTERDYHYDETSPLTTPHMKANMADGYRYRYMVFSENTPRISWDWYIDPEGHAFEVLHEFRNMGPISHLPKQDFQLPERMFNWPYFYPRWQSFRSALRAEEMRSPCKTLIKIFDNRFERRWLKKVRKLRRVQGIGENPKVPGAWID